jgi:phenylalanine ammonia-lyase
MRNRLYNWVLSQKVVRLDGRSLTLEDVEAVARNKAKVELAPSVPEQAQSTYDLNQRMISAGTTVYGVTTGVGDSVGRKVAVAGANELQESLVRLNGCGTGPDLPADQSRAVVLARANCLARGNSAVRPLVPQMMVEMLNLGFAPVIPEQGSIGASGDLVPSSYIGAVLMGEREVLRSGERLAAAQVWSEAGREPLRLHAKEGLAILNGTCFMTGIAALTLLDAVRLADVVDICTAMTCEGLLGITGPFHPFIHSLKPHPGQARSAQRTLELLRGSTLVTDYDAAVASGRRVQENYSLRCAPQCNGVLRDTVEWAKQWVERELNSANDNPLYDPVDARVHSGGNFSGFHIALAMDALKMAVASVADLIDRQFELLVDEKYSAGLPANLTRDLGIDDPAYGTQHGFKSFQIALSSLAAEALARCMPMSAFSRSTEAHNQDKVSMGAAAARSARDVVEITQRCCAMHLIGAAQAADLRGADRLGEGTSVIYRRIRAVSSFVDRDRPLQHDIVAVADLVRSGALLAGL